MKTRIAIASFLALTVIAAAGQFRAAAQSEPVRIFASNGVKAAVDALRTPAEGTISHPLNLQYGTTVVNKQKIESGEPFDVAILTSEAIDALIKEGKIA